MCWRATAGWSKKVGACARGVGPPDQGPEHHPAVRRPARRGRDAGPCRKPARTSRRRTAWASAGRPPWGGLAGRVAKVPEGRQGGQEVHGRPIASVADELRMGFTGGYGRFSYSRPPATVACVLLTASSASGGRSCATASRRRYADAGDLRRICVSICVNVTPLNAKPKGRLTQMRR